MAEEIYNLKYSGEETDEILESAKNVKEANLTTLNDISGFVCIDKNGNAIGMMSKEQVAQVVGGLLDYYKFDSSTYNDDLNLLTGNKYIRLGDDCTNLPSYESSLGSIVCCIEWDLNAGFQVYYGCNTGKMHFRGKFNSAWKQWVEVS